jgi:hypothetical protein
MIFYGNLCGVCFFKTADVVWIFRKTKPTEVFPFLLDGLFGAVPDRHAKKHFLNIPISTWNAIADALIKLPWGQCASINQALYKLLTSGNGFQ